jgi:hypothetical protein
MAVVIELAEDSPLLAIRSRLRKMSDAELSSYGRSAAYMASPAAAYGTPRATWAEQLAEAREEWRKRQTKNAGK